jgi:hypothetical protein
MGQESGHQDSGSRVEEIPKDKQVCSEDRRYILELLNMTLKDLIDLAYAEGLKDGREGR